MLPKPLPATGKRCNFGTPLWCLLDSLGCLQRWGCAHTRLVYLQSAGSQGAEARSRTCRSHCVSQRLSLCTPAGPTAFPNHGCPAGEPGSSGKVGPAETPRGGLGTAVALSGGGLGAGLGNHKLSCRTTKPVTTRCCSTPPDVKSHRFPSQERTLSISLNPECPSDLTSAGTKKFCFQGLAKNPFQNKKDRQLLTKGSAQSSFTRPLEGAEGSPLSQDLGDPNQHVQSEGWGPPPGRTPSPFQRALPAPQPTSGSPFSLPGIPHQLSFPLFLPAALTTSFLSVFGLE